MDLLSWDVFINGARDRGVNPRDARPRRRAGPRSGRGRRETLETARGDRDRPLGAVAARAFLPDVGLDYEHHSSLEAHALLGGEPEVGADEGRLHTAEPDPVRQVE